FLSQSGKERQDIYNILTQFHFDASEATKLIGVLSPGGRTRLLLAMFTIMHVNTLLLDEPTNHLDIEAMEAIEQALGKYSGSVISISHDRYFVEHVGFHRLLKMENGKLTEVPSLSAYEKGVEGEAKRMLKTL